MHRSMTGDSPFSRRRWLGMWLPALLVVAATLLGGESAVAQEGQPLGFVWGPATAQEEMRPPFNGGMLPDAMDMAVDEDAISTSVLGQPSLLVFVYDTSWPQELENGSTLIDPEGAKAVLKDWGITSVTLTIAADADVPEAIAEGIAADLRANIGAHVTVVDGAADFRVTRAAPSPTPVPPLPAGTVAFEHTCTPDTLRPDEWVVIDCVARTTNESQDSLTNIHWTVGGTFDGPIPTSFFVWSKRDGEFQPLSTNALSYGGYDLSPGQTVETHTVFLLRMSEGTFTTEAVLWAGERQGPARPIRFVATKDAADPPTGLVVTEELMGGPTNGESMPTATYETKITNRGSAAVTQLTVIDRYDEYAAFVSAQPAPSTRNPTIQLDWWDLPAFGKDSLAPGESLVLRTTYGPSSDSGGCSSVTPGVIVEAMVDGQERLYGARAEDSATVGKCDYEGNIGGGRGGGEWGVGGGGGVMAAPASGEGPAAAAGDNLWTAMALASGGLTLVVAARAMRKRV